MARFCSKCKKKFKFFEKDFNGICKNCYEENLRKLEEERIRKEKEKLEKIKKQEEKRRLEEQKRLEEQQKKLEEKRRLEEQKRIEEEQKKQEEKRRLEKQRKIEEQKIIEEKKKQRIIEQQKLKQIKIENFLKLLIVNNEKKSYNNILILYLFLINELGQNEIELNDDMFEILWDFMIDNSLGNLKTINKSFHNVILNKKYKFDDITILNTNIFNDFLNYLYSLKDNIYINSYYSKRKVIEINNQSKIIKKAVNYYSQNIKNKENNKFFLVALLYYCSIFIGLKCNKIEKNIYLTFEIDYTKYISLNNQEKIIYLTTIEEEKRYTEEKDFFNNILYKVKSNYKLINLYEKIIGNIINSIYIYPENEKNIKFILNNAILIINEAKKIQKDKENIKIFQEECERKKQAEAKKYMKELKNKIRIENNKKKNSVLLEYKKNLIYEIISYPNIVTLYKNIVENNIEEIKQINLNFNSDKNDFEKKILDYIIELKMSEGSDIVWNSEDFKNIKNTYLQSDIFNKNYISNILAKYFMSGKKDFKIINIKIYNKIKKEFENSYLCSIDEKKQFLSLSLIYYCSFILNYAINLCYISDKLFENEELEEIYNKLRSVTNNIEYISNTLYPMYIKFYNNINEKLLNTDFQIIIALKENIFDNKISNICKNIKSKKQFVNYIVENINQINNFNNTDKVFFICKIIEENKEYMNYKTIYEIIFNIDDFLIEITNSVYLNKADEERKRILNGDLSKEIEMQKQAVEYSNVQNGYEFEEYVANLYKKLGYTIEEVTKKSGDQGADVIAYKDNKKYVIQAKFYNNPVGNKAVQEVVASIGMYKANKGIVVTNSTFTSSAVELAQANNIELVDGEKIEELKKIIIDNI